MALFLGYDPGGNDKHGVAALEIEPASYRVLRVTAKTVPTAEAVMAFFVNAMGARPAAGIGVDTLTEWCLGLSGWRPPDLWLRDRYPEVKNSVAASNSLYGAMSLNGMSVIICLRQVIPALPVTETHPKVLYFALSGKTYDWTSSRQAMNEWLSNQLGGAPINASSDDAFDAVVSAWACAQGVLGRWKRDLHALDGAGLHDSPIVRPAGPTRYFWP